MQLVIEGLRRIRSQGEASGWTTPSASQKMKLNCTTWFTLTCVVPAPATSFTSSARSSGCHDFSSAALLRLGSRDVATRSLQLNFCTMDKMQFLLRGASAGGRSFKERVCYRISVTCRDDLRQSVSNSVYTYHKTHFDRCIPSLRGNCEAHPAKPIL